MGNTAGNQDNAIVTNGSTHTATTKGSTDRCYVKAMTEAYNFPNHIKSKGNVRNGTTNTTIACHPILVKDAHLGPKSGPAHVGEGGGVTSKTYIDVARPTTYSKDVRAENLYVVRTNDATTQNKGNTTGYIEGDPLKAKASYESEYAKLACTLVTMTGFCVHGRSIGRWPGKGGRDREGNYYLEVLGGDEVLLSATRRNLIHQASGPRCAKGHSSWKTSRKYQATAPMDEDKSGVDAYEVPKRMLKYPEVIFNEVRVMGTTLQRTGDLRESEIKDYRDLSVRAEHKDPGRANDMMPQRHSRPDQKHLVDMKNQKSFIKAALMWNAIKDPPEVTVKAGSCNGDMRVTLKVLPYSAVSFNLIDDKIEQRVKVLKDALQFAEKLAAMFNQRIYVQFLRDPDLELTIEYKELKEDRPARKIGFVDVDACYAVQVRRSWALTFGFNPFFLVKLKFLFPVANLFGVVGALVAKGLEKIGMRADLAVTVDFSFNPKGKITWDEYSTWDAKVYADLKLALYGSLEVKAKVVELVISTGMDSTLRFSNWRPDLRRACLLGCDVHGMAQFFMRGSARVSLLGVEDREDLNWEPAWGKFGELESGVMAKDKSGRVVEKGKLGFLPIICPF